MTGCRFDSLDALLAGELSKADAHELEAHVRGCASCTHELKWLETERALFEQRAQKGLRARKGLRAAGDEPRVHPRPSRAVGLAAGLLAASVFLAVITGRVDQQSPQATDPFIGGASVDPQLVIVSMEHRYGACLVATPGDTGRPCGPVIPASFP